MYGVVVSVYPWVRVARSSNYQGMETTKVGVPWPGGWLGGRSSTDNVRVVAVTGIPEALGGNHLMKRVMRQMAAC